MLEGFGTALAQIAAEAVQEQFQLDRQADVEALERKVHVELLAMAGQLTHFGEGGIHA